MSLSLSQSRLHHIDLLRGIIIIFMVIDHGMYYCLNYSVTDLLSDNYGGRSSDNYLGRLI